eukprot:2004564-Heterocapsa_arctica.AAC.2
MSNCGRTRGCQRTHCQLCGQIPCQGKCKDSGGWSLWVIPTFTHQGPSNLQVTSAHLFMSLLSTVSQDLPARDWDSR